jgi:hypothetical protein
MRIFIGLNSVTRYLKPNPKSFKLSFTVAVGGPTLTPLFRRVFHFISYQPCHGSTSKSFQHSIRKKSIY